MVEENHIGVVTVTYNSGQVMDGFLRSMLAQTHRRFTLYVIDNASSDSTLEVMARFPDERTVTILNKDNLGVATGNNQGIKAALADGCTQILLLNNDTEFEPELLAGLSTSLIRTQADMIVPKIMFFEPSNHIWCAGGKFDRLRGYTSFHLGGDELDKGQCDYSMDVEYCPTCCMLIASEVFEKIGVMDDAYFVYWDDSDFCYRAMKHNMRLYYDHSLRLYHKVHSLTGGNSSNFSQRYYTRNKVYFLLKNLGWLGLFHLIPFWIYLLLDPRIMKKGWALRQRAFMEGLKLSFSKIWVTEHH